MGRRLLVMVTLLLVFGSGTARAAFAPLDRPGPALTPSAADLAASLRCTGSLEGATRDPVLLLGGTTVSTDDEFTWNYEPALKNAGIPFCTSDEPGTLDQNLGDIQLRGEYVVYALREMARRSGRKVAVFGHSQGGMVTRWALRFWPDTRTLVSDVVGAAPSNHGTVDADGLCGAGLGCSPAIWQQANASHFYAALNSGQETFAGIDYTAIATDMDEVVVPYTQTRLSGPGTITNVTVQDVCPADVADHIVLGTSDAVAYALFRDAIDHPGPADPARIDKAVCNAGIMPGVNPATFATDAAASATALATNLATYPKSPAEPAPACYTTDPSTCAPDAPASTPAATTPASAAPRACTSARRVTIHLPRGLRGARVRVAGRAVRVRGRVATVDLRGTRARSVRILITGRRAGRVVRTVRTFHPCRTG